MSDKRSNGSMAQDAYCAAQNKETEDIAPDANAKASANAFAPSDDECVADAPSEDTYYDQYVLASEYGLF